MGGILSMDCREQLLAAWCVRHQFDELLQCEQQRQRQQQRQQRIQLEWRVPSILVIEVTTKKGEIKS